MSEESQEGKSVWDRFTRFPNELENLRITEPALGLQEKEMVLLRLPGAVKLRVREAMTAPEESLQVTLGADCSTDRSTTDA